MIGTAVVLAPRALINSTHDGQRPLAHVGSSTLPPVLKRACVDDDLPRLDPATNPAQTPLMGAP